MGGLSCPRRRFSTSISDTRMLGDTAETGTMPDSAPQVPLKTSGSSAKTWQRRFPFGASHDKPRCVIPARRDPTPGTTTRAILGMTTV